MKTTGVIISVIILVNLSFTCASNVDSPKRDDKKSKSVTTYVSAKWETTPIVLELAEYLAGENADLFWSFVDGINSLRTSLDNLGKFLYILFFGICISRVTRSHKILIACLVFQRPINRFTMLVSAWRARCWHQRSCAWQSLRYPCTPPRLQSVCLTK